MNSCLISIVVPVYQVEDYIEDSMTSITRQTYKNFEVILVDDGSKDSSISIAEKVFITQNVNYRVISQENKGVSSARNTGIKSSRGTWIVCIDPDDIIHEDFLKILHDGCIENSLNVVFGNFKMVTQDNKWQMDKINDMYTIYNQNEILMRFLKREIKLISPGILIKRSFLFNNNLWYKEEIRFSEDQHFIWRLLFLSEKVGYFGTPIYNYLIRENSTMTSSKKDKILTGFHGFSELNESLYKLNTVTKFILPRWVFGALRSATRTMEFHEFFELAKSMNYKKYGRSLLSFPDFITRIMALLLILNLKCFYFLNKKI